MRRAGGGTVALGLAAAAVAAIALWPLAMVLAGATRGAAGVLGVPRTWALFGRSLGLSALVTAGALALGVPLGALFARARIGLRRTLFVAHAAPMFLPPFLLALGWFHLFGASAPLGSERSAAVLFSPAGVCLVLAATFAPIVTALTAIGVLGLDPSLEEAARTVTGPQRVLARILVPAARPQITLAALVVFSLAFAEVAVPTFLRDRTYSAAVVARLGGAGRAPAEAAALCVPVLALALGIVSIERSLFRSHGAASLVFRRDTRAPLDLGRGPTIAASVAALVSAAPIVALAMAARGHLGEASSWVSGSAGNSVVSSLAAAVVATLLAIVAGHALARDRAAARALDRVLLLAFVAPPAVLAVGLVATWNRPATQLVYASPAILVVGFVARYAVVATRAFAAAVAQRPRSFEEAAQAAGAGYVRRLARVVLPMHARGASAAFTLVLVLSLRDVDTAISFYPPGGEPLTVRIFTLEANGPPGVVAALSLLHVAVTIAALVPLALVAARRTA